MRELKELALMADPSELKLTARNLLFFEGDTLLNRFFEGIVEDVFDSDEEALKVLYPGEVSTGNYRKLKFTLKKRLKEAILLFDEKNRTSTSYQKAYYQCYKEWAMVKILLGQNARNAAVEIAQGILKKAEKFEFTELSVDVCSVLRLHYGARLGDKAKFDTYNKRFKKYRELYFLEEDAQEAYVDLIMNYVNDRSPKTDQYKRAKQALEHLDDLGIEGDTHQYRLYRYLIELMAATTIYDYKAALDICEKGITYFSAKPYETQLPLQIFYYQELVCHVQLGQFEAGQEVAQKCLKIMQEGSFNWFKYQELYLILALYTEKYEEAGKIYWNTTKHTRFQFLPENTQKVWMIYHAYLYFLASSHRISTPRYQGLIKDAFDYDHFLEEVVTFSKDKSGLNAAILIAQNLIAIVEERYEEVIDRMEAHQQYCYRYLNSEHTKRTYLFMKMVLKIPRYGFDKAKIEEKTQKLKSELVNVPLEVANQAVELEIIPYEKLWDLILAVLSPAKQPKEI
ncbi:MAG TPA: hypothetical protein VJ953_13230 [Saprospiraceae bacterium]|nr:hypothetical protein [Saprospiraceae bacterium]